MKSSPGRHRRTAPFGKALRVCGGLRNGASDPALPLGFSNSKCHVIIILAEWVLGTRLEVGPLGTFGQ